MCVNSPPIFDWKKFQSSKLNITTGLPCLCVIAIGVQPSTTRSIAAEKFCEISVKVAISMMLKVARFRGIVKHASLKSRYYFAVFEFTTILLNLRHSRESGNPSPDFSVYATALDEPDVPVLDSRLRGNGEMG